MAYFQDVVAHGFWVDFIVWQPLSEQMEDMPVLISRCWLADLWLLYGSLYTCSMYWMICSIDEINHQCSVRGRGCQRPSPWTSCMKVKVTIVHWSGSNTPPYWCCVSSRGARESQLGPSLKNCSFKELGLCNPPYLCWFVCLLGEGWRWMGGHHLTSDQLYEFGGHYSSPVRVLGTIPYEVKMVCVSVGRGGGMQLSSDQL